jgi:hypothetical protein
MQAEIPPGPKFDLDFPSLTNGFSPAPVEMVLRVVFPFGFKFLGFEGFPCPSECSAYDSLNDHACIVLSHSIPPCDSLFHACFAIFFFSFRPEYGAAPGANFLQGLCFLCDFFPPFCCLFFGHQHGDWKETGVVVAVVLGIYMTLCADAIDIGSCHDPFHRDAG